MRYIYIVAWTGGYETPGFFSTHNKTDAAATYFEWKDDCNFDDGDRVDVVRIDTESGRTLNDQTVLDTEILSEDDLALEQGEV